VVRCPVPAIEVALAGSTAGVGVPAGRWQRSHGRLLHTILRRHHRPQAMAINVLLKSSDSDRARSALTSSVRQFHRSGTPPDEVNPKTLRVAASSSILSCSCAAYPYGVGNRRRRRRPTGARRIHTQPRQRGIAVHTARRTPWILRGMARLAPVSPVAVQQLRESVRSKGRT
jgi:hypothetical protein